ncbi:hypothetical protein NE237_022752 [Protea cynaroides]|uniref:Uncharacterized protein n=1 Tax=Protea cynaroides TaxID=273540 RepID=A0A9Q0HDN5_9MAGN|nr:hypothetical protein NE237_022752 [Protea cynaroides]
MSYSQPLDRSGCLAAGVLPRPNLQRAWSKCDDKALLFAQIRIVPLISYIRSYDSNLDGDLHGAWPPASRKMVESRDCPHNLANLGPTPRCFYLDFISFILW